MCETARETIGVKYFTRTLRDAIFGRVSSVVEINTHQTTSIVEKPSKISNWYISRVCACMDVVREWGSLTPPNTKTARGRRVFTPAHVSIYFISLLLRLSSSSSRYQLDIYSPPQVVKDIVTISNVCVEVSVDG